MRSTGMTLLIMLLITSISEAQPSVVWTRTYGGAWDDYLYDMQMTPDGGFLFAGESQSFSAAHDFDAYLLRTNANGDSLWSRTFGGESDEAINTIRPTADGGYILAGHTYSLGPGAGDMWLVKINAVGDVQWQQAFGSATTNEWCSAAEQTTDGGYILCGHTAPRQFAYPDAILIRTNSVGTLLWQRTYDGNEDFQETAYDVHQTADGGFILCGFNDDYISGHGLWDAWVLKTDSQGNNPVERLYGGTQNDAAYSMVLLPDGGYALAGFTDASATIPNDFYLVRLNAALDTLWTKHWGRMFVDEPTSLIRTSDGGFLMTGHTCIPFFGNCRWDWYAVRTDANGDSLWTFRYGGPLNDYALVSRQSADGGYVMAGFTASPDTLHYDARILKLEGDVSGCPDLTPRAPTGLTAIRAGNDLQLGWRPVTRSVADCPITVTSYVVRADSMANGSFATIVGTTADTVHTIAGAVNAANQQFYRVTATTP